MFEHLKLINMHFNFLGFNQLAWFNHDLMECRFHWPWYPVIRNHGAVGETDCPGLSHGCLYLW